MGLNANNTAALTAALAAFFPHPAPTTARDDSWLLTQKALEIATVDDGWIFEYESPPSEASTSDGIESTLATSEVVCERMTTGVEQIVGEIRSWRLLNSDWDGEGAQQPVAASLKEAEAFARLCPEHRTLPEPMLHASGRAGLYWKTDGLYADLEFLGDGQIAYYIERRGDRHKGQVRFDPEKMPSVFPALLDA
jgi:hypothetical protein